MSVFTARQDVLQEGGLNNTFGSSISQGDCKEGRISWSKLLHLRLKAMQLVEEVAD